MVGLQLAEEDGAAAVHLLLSLDGCFRNGFVTNRSLV